MTTEQNAGSAIPKITRDDEEAGSGDLARENVERLKALFPQIVADGQVDFDVLRQLLGDDVVDGEERYGLNWKGKRRARAFAMTPSLGTLRPAPEDSVKWDSTQNIMIEGDNLEVLKLLRRSYTGKVKLIYIDPPYNTGNDFVYADNYRVPIRNYLEVTGQTDTSGTALTSDSDIAGRGHGSWLSMMLPRLIIAHELLSENGLFFASISDAEAPRFQSILEEVFGEANFLGNIIWNSTKSVTNTALISVSHTHTLVFAKNIDFYVKNRSEFRLPDDGSGFSNPDNDPRGPWKADPFQVGGERPNQLYEIENPKTGQKYRPQEGNSWKNDFKKFQVLMEEGRIIFGATGEAGPQRKRFLSEAQDRGKVAKTLWDDVGTTTNGTRRVKELLGPGVFSNPKPVELLERIIELASGSDEEMLCLDFFAGSGTTAEAVMRKNLEDGRSRRFISVQLPESLDPEDKEQRAAVKFLDELGKPRNISELTKERLRRAGREIADGNSEVDAGFRVYKLATSNLKPWQPDPDNLEASILDAIDNVLPDRSEEDLLVELLLKTGIDLTMPEETREIAGRTVHALGGGALMVCLGNISDEQAEDLGQGMADWVDELDPAQTTVYFKDSGIGSDGNRAATKANLAAILRQRLGDRIAKIASI